MSIPRCREAYLTGLDIAVCAAQTRMSIPHMLEMRDSETAHRILDAIVSFGGDPAEIAKRLGARGSGKLRRAKEAAFAKEWRATKSAAVLRRIYFDYIEGSEEA